MDERLLDLSDYNLIERRDEGDNVFLSLKKKSRDYLSVYTMEMETDPEIGDMAIVWDIGEESKARIVRLADKEFAADYQDYPYKAHTGEWFRKGVRFRNPDQFDKIIKYKENATKEEVQSGRSEKTAG